MFRAVAGDIRQFLRNERSWAPGIPDDVTALVRSVVVLLAMPADPASYRELAGRVAAFDASGNRAAESGQRPRGRVAGAGGRAVEGIKGAAALVAALGGIAVLVITWALFAAHVVSIGYVGGHML